ncbi:hypothetical protein EOL96_06935 [Candidatus Saccharibacteria bacterium]|nr:hypothetical protein [Candidatus Saccharibacteria bacterium]
MVEIKAISGTERQEKTTQDTSIVALQDIVEIEYAKVITYEEAQELGEALLEFFGAFSEEGVGDGDTA